MNNQFGPKRKVRSNGRTVVGQVSSLKNNCIQFESGLEEGLIYILAMDHQVEKIYSQPVQIQYLDEKGKVRTYTPDFLVQFKNRSVAILEVKSLEAQTRDADHFQRITKAGQDYCAARSWTYHVLTEDDIRTGYAYNARFLFKYEARTLDEKSASLVLGALRLHGRLPLGQLIEMLTSADDEAGAYLTTIWILLWRKEITCDFFQKLTTSSELWISNGDLNELKYPYR